MCRAIILGECGGSGRIRNDDLHDHHGHDDHDHDGDGDGGDDDDDDDDEDEDEDEEEEEEILYYHIVLPFLWLLLVYFH